MCATNKQSGRLPTHKSMLRVTGVIGAGPGAAGEQMTTRGGQWGRFAVEGAAGVSTMGAQARCVAWGPRVTRGHEEGRQGAC